MFIKKILNKLFLGTKHFTDNFSKFIITEELRHALNLIERNEFTILFITGKAGTGKSSFLKYIKFQKLKHNAAYLAPTGVASVNIQGDDSFVFQIPPTIHHGRRY